MPASSPFLPVFPLINVWLTHLFFFSSFSVLFHCFPFFLWNVLFGWIFARRHRGYWDVLHPSDGLWPQLYSRRYLLRSPNRLCYIKRSSCIVCWCCPLAVVDLCCVMGLMLCHIFPLKPVTWLKVSQGLGNPPPHSVCELELQFVARFTITVQKSFL